MKRNILDLWSLVMALIEYGGCTQLFVNVGRIYLLEIGMMSPEFFSIITCSAFKLGTKKRKHEHEKFYN